MADAAPTVQDQPEPGAPAAAPEQAAVEAPPSPAPPVIEQDPNESEQEASGVGADEELANIEPPVEPRVWKFEGDFTVVQGGQEIPQHFVGEYVQKPLSYFAMLEFTGLLARKIDEAMSGPGAITVKDIVDTAKASIPYVVDGGRVEAVIEQGEFDGIDVFVQGLMKVASYVPDVIEECQFIWLRVPRRERAFLREVWGRPADEGGMTADEGEEMLSVFIDQNYEELEAFFVERLPRLGKVATAARKRKQNNSTGSPRSKPWRRTAEPTLSQ